jgi:hypothetical protein
MRNDVELRSTDDRLYRPCFDKNEELAISRRNAVKWTEDHSLTAAAEDTTTVKQLVGTRIDKLRTSAIIPARYCRIAYEANQPTNQSDSATTTISQLRSTFHEQQITITKLQKQLNFVLSFLGS